MKTEVSQDLLISRLKQFRKEKGFTQAEMAEKIGVATVNYAKYECGKRNPSLPKLIEIAITLEKPLECFIYEDREKMKLTPEQVDHLRTLDSKQLCAILEQLRKLYQSQK